MHLTILFVMLLFLPVFSTPSLAYVGPAAGLLDDDYYGVGLVFGLRPKPVGGDVELLFGGDRSPFGGGMWFIINGDVTYDFIESLNSFKNYRLHPFLKGGLTVAGRWVEVSSEDVAISAGVGPNIGVGLDWEPTSNSWFTIGFETTGTYMINMNDSGWNTWIFNALIVFKLGRWN